MTCVLGTDDASLAALLIASLAGDETITAAVLLPPSGFQNSSLSSPSVSSTTACGATSYF